MILRLDTKNAGFTALQICLFWASMFNFKTFQKLDQLGHFSMKPYKFPSPK